MKKNIYLFHQAIQDFNENKFEESEKKLLHFLEQNPGESKANELLAYIYLNRKEEKRGFSFLQKACALDSSTGAANYHFGTLLLKEKNYESAAKYFLKAIDIDGNIFDYLHDLGTAYAHLNQYDDAALAYSEAKKSIPFLQFCHLILAGYTNRGKILSRPLRNITTVLI